MSIVKFVLIFFLSISFAYCEINNVKKYGLKRIAYIKGNLFTTEKESKIGEKLWKKEMKTYGINVEIKAVRTEKEALELWEKKEIHSLVDDGTFYYKYKTKLDSLINYKWIISRKGKMFTQYYLIINRESTLDFNKLNKNKIYYKDKVAKIWFEYLLLTKDIKTNEILSRMEKVEKDKNLIFNSFFNKNSISIITKDLYDSMMSFNPQIKNKIEIVAKSKAIFFNAIGITLKSSDNYNDIMKSFIKENKSDLEILSFVKIQKVYPVEKDELKETDKFFEEYFNLKK